MASSKKSSKKSSTKPAWQRWLRKQLSHRRLLLLEAVLLLAAGEMWLEEQVLASAIHPAWQVLFSMALVIGMFGLLLALAESVLLVGLEKGHGVVQALPLPTPLLAIHLFALIGLFYLHAWLLGLTVWPS